LRVRIARGRPCTPVLVIPQRKMSLVEAHHGRAAMAGLKLMKGGHGGSLERKGRGRGREEVGAATGALLGAPWGGC
jgi:hypothetical protein